MQEGQTDPVAMSRVKASNFNSGVFLK